MNKLKQILAYCVSRLSICTALFLIDIIYFNGVVIENGIPEIFLNFIACTMYIEQ